MAEIQPVAPVKLIAAILWSQQSTLGQTLDLLTESFGAIDFQSADYPFDTTDYYQSEMGENLKRRIIAFNDLISPETIVKAKQITNTMEMTISGCPARTVNIDIGFIDHNKLVLASVKDAGQKIHLGQGIYADMICRYQAGQYHALPWAFPDFKDNRYRNELLAVRKIYLAQRKAHPHTIR